MNLKRVVVTGLGTLTPIGNNVSQLWDSLLKGVSGAGLITHFDSSNLKCHIAAEVKGFDGTQYFDRKEIRTLDLFTQYGLVAVDEALKDSGLDIEKIDRDRVGVIFGTGMGGAETFQNELLSYAVSQNTPRFSPFFITKTIGDICAGQISIRYGFHGPNYSTTAACASSAMSIADAFMMLQLGKVDVMITGGSEAAIIPVGIGGFSSMKALSLRNDDPATASRPFDKDRDGFVLGEGAGTLILEELEHAKAEGVAEGKVYTTVGGLVKREIKRRDVGVVGEMVDGGWDNVVFDGQDGGYSFYGTSGSEKVASHGFGGVQRDMAGVVAEKGDDGTGFGDVADGGRGAVGVDVVDIGWLHAGFGNGLAHGEHGSFSLWM